MIYTKIGDSTVVSNDDGPELAIIYPSHRAYGDRRINLDWKDEISERHFSAVPSKEDGIKFIEARMDAIQVMKEKTNIFRNKTDLRPIVIENIIRRIVEGEDIFQVLASMPGLTERVVV